VAVSLNEFNDMHALAQTDLPKRVLGVVERSEQARTAGEVAAELLGISERYMALVGPEVRQVLPAVVRVLDVHVAHGLLRRLVLTHPMRGDETYYAKLRALAVA
jgi:hypothetical protein